MGRRAVWLIAATVVIVGTGTATVYERTRSLSPSEVLRRSFSTMAAVRTVHAAGRVHERGADPGDPQSMGSWRVQGDCTSRGATTSSQFSVAGSQTGRHPKVVDEQYVVGYTQPPDKLPTSRRSWHVWTRSVHPASSWHRTELTYHARLVASMCPAFIVPQLHPLPGPVEDMGRTSINGRYATHLQSAFDGQGGGETVDVYVDPASFRWVRIDLRGWGPGCCYKYDNLFEYSRYNVPVTVRFPPRSG